ncbi:nuclear transport factor 2 family protein [Opitutus terrae]|uniref:Putative secreted protein n=1 Tax=Opitutus terrae (strain DSM 11246 / JCM 15787 / PB90-1) TaxID=452637 RepID=B1ZXW0_OPITP|nr:nuclear transport factor 2 family protein [Opitutus terrae]ACB75162.1 putative secreted protein [Opitutus terrae PB90-1]
MKSGKRPTPRSNRVTTDRQSLLACERELTRAERTGDAATLRALLARDFVGIDLHGRKVTRRTFIAGFLRPELKLAQLRIDDLTVRRTGEMACVVGRSQFTGTFAGRPISGRARFVDVWIHRRSRWQLIGSSVTRIER